MSSTNSDRLTNEIFSKMREEVQTFFETHDQITSSREYEDKIFELAQKFAAGMVSASAGKLPKDRNAKKSPDHLGPV